MVVLSLTDVPMALKGDLSKWMIAINTGVFVGSFSARVRDELWERVCENIKNGKATMVYNTNGEQGMEFRVHNTTWQPVDYDGIKLIKKVFEPKEALPQGFSKAAKYQKLKRLSRMQSKKPGYKPKLDEYVAVDIETTGLRPGNDEITEIAAVRYENGVEKESFCKLVKITQPLKESIIKLTGITDEMLRSKGEDCKEVIEKFAEFVGETELVCHNASFDMSFINHACEAYGMRRIENKVCDTLDMAKKQISDIESYKLNSLVQYFCIVDEQSHRAIDDCRLAAKVYEKLKAKNES